MRGAHEVLVVKERVGQSRVFFDEFGHDLDETGVPVLLVALGLAFQFAVEAEHGVGDPGGRAGAALPRSRE